MRATFRHWKDLVASTDINNVTPDQTEQLKAKTETLKNISQQLFSKMYEQAQAAQGGAQAGPDMNAGAGSPHLLTMLLMETTRKFNKKRLIRKFEKISTVG
ncbi:MAG: hypothetical protein ACLRZ6_11780 [Lachnospiraceae bacterium]